MSRRESKVDNMKAFVDTEFSSGDSNKIKSKSKQHCQEENNNEIDELSRDLSEMGCIVDAMKRPPNICVETCIYEESDSDEEQANNEVENDEDAYTDEFEDDKSDVEEVIKIDPQSAKSECTLQSRSGPSGSKLSKSQSLTSSKPISLSGKSSYGSLAIPETRRINMSFTNQRLREIERHNHILLTKILSVRNSHKSSIPPREREQPSKRPALVPSAALHRKKQQRQIEHDNMILLKKIQRVKSSSCSIRR